jgi:hypothetical protein
VLADGVLPVGAVFGNEDGCNMFMTGRQEDSAVLLTEHTFTYGLTGCYFEALESEDSSGLAVDMSCSAKGQASERQFLVVIPAEGIAGYFAYIGDIVFGPLKLCPGNEARSKSQGTQI